MATQFPPPDNTRPTSREAAKQLGMELQGPIKEKASRCAMQALQGSPALDRMAKQVELFDKQVAAHTDNLMRIFGNKAIALDSLSANDRKMIQQVVDESRLQGRVLKQFTDEVVKSLGKQKDLARREALQERAANIIDLIAPTGENGSTNADAAANAITRIYDI